MKLYEILVPCKMLERQTGEVRPVSTKHHKAWDRKVMAVTRGLTILLKQKGKWLSDVSGVHSENMIPVRIACGENSLGEVIRITKNHYNQEAVFVYEVSPNAMIR